ncbi:MAG: tetratricopeptide repeat protein [Chloroflexi bacterium]|nr:MAG: tetratricopeptide repeat protein [Chloroflexota bacterium]
MFRRSAATRKKYIEKGFGVVSPSRREGKLAGSARVRALSPRTPELLGARIRKARLAAGLSLAAVAQTDFSRAYLNQIELGRARPSTRILQIISERLRRPIEYFLQDPQNSILAVEFVLTEARTRLRQGDAAGVQTMVTGLLARPHLPLEVKCRARLSLAEALLNLRSIPEAIDLLRATIRDTETNGWRILTVELYDKMGSAYYLRRQPHEAGRWWDKALSLYEDANVNDPVLKARILGHRANVHYVAGQPREAIAGYEAAIEAAEAVLDMKQLGGIYEGLAMAFDRAGDLTRALEYAQRSLRLFETLNDVRMSAQLRNNMAEILLHQGQPIEAEALFLTGAEQLQRVGDKDLYPHLMAGAAEAAFDQGNHELAKTRIALALARAKASNDPLARFAAFRIAGRIAHADGRPDDARGQFEAALQIAQSVGSAMEESQVAYDYAQALEEQGNATEALARYRQAYQARQRAVSA